MKNTYLLIFFCFLMQKTSAQSSGRPNDSLPPYNDEILNTLIKDYRLVPVGKLKANIITNKTFIDTIYPVFSQFAIGTNVYSKNTNTLIAEVSTKESRFGYNISLYHKKLKGISNIEVFAFGKDNLANIFSEAKLQGSFGFALSHSFLKNSSLRFLPSENEELMEVRKSYFYILKRRGDILEDISVEENLRKKIKTFEENIAKGTSLTIQKGRYDTLKTLRDSVALICAYKEARPDRKRTFYDTEIVAFEKKLVKFTGFTLHTLDVRGSYSNEGFNYYSMSNDGTTFPNITENAKRFNRFSLGFSYNYFRHRADYSWRSSVGPTFSHHIGFDDEKAKDIEENTDFDSLNVKRSFSKKYNAYLFKEDILENKFSLGIASSQQIFVGKNKNFGAELSPSFRRYLSGNLSNKNIIDLSFGLLAALNKKGDAASRNVVSFLIKTPDILNETPLSRNDDGTTRKMKDKMEISINFGFSLNKLAYKM